MDNMNKKVKAMYFDGNGNWLSDKIVEVTGDTPMYRYLRSKDSSDDSVVVFTEVEDTVEQAITKVTELMNSVNEQRKNLESDIADKAFKSVLTTGQEDVILWDKNTKQIMSCGVPSSKIYAFAYRRCAEGKAYVTKLLKMMSETLEQVPVELKGELEIAMKKYEDDIKEFDEVINEISDLTNVELM